MADLYTLSPSPPALGDPHAAQSIPSSSSSALAAAESSREMPIPKSSLYNDKALTGNVPEARIVGSTSAPQPPLSPTKPAVETPLQSLVHEAAPQEEESAGKEAETGANVQINDPAAAQLVNVKAETPALSSEPSAQSEAQQATPCPDVNPGPNLYPSVHVTHNPNPVMDDGQFTATQLQTTVSDVPPASPVPPHTEVAPAEENPQPSLQAQNPEGQLPPLSPKPETPSKASKEEPPSTPIRAEHPSPPVPVIHEPAPVFQLPKPRPAPDSLSYLESASLMSGTLESLSGLGEDGSSVGSDSEVNGLAVRRTDKYGFLGGNQYSESG